MKALSSFKIDTLVESRYFAIALNGLLILAISIWLLNQWLSKEINSSAPLLMPTAHNIQPQGQPDRTTALTDMAYALSSWHLCAEIILQQNEKIGMVKAKINLARE